MGTRTQNSQRSRHHRRLTSTQRAGEFSRHEARRLQYEFAARNWKVLLLFVVGLFALELPLGFLAPAAYREFALGALVATAIWAVVHLVVIGSGTAPLMMGDTGEQWTASELRKLGSEAQ